MNSGPYNYPKAVICLAVHRIRSPWLDPKLMAVILRKPMTILWNTWVIDRKRSLKNVSWCCVPFLRICIKVLRSENSAAEWKSWFLTKPSLWGGIPWGSPPPGFSCPLWEESLGLLRWPPCRPQRVSEGRLAFSSARPLPYSTPTVLITQFPTFNRFYFCASKFGDKS